ncbi:MAG: hypothetical protein WD907_02975 [Bacilli bacterium]
MLVEITGIDGSGKSTLIAKLRKHFNSIPLTWAYERSFKNRGKRFLEHIALQQGKSRPEEIFDPALIEFHNALEMVEEINKHFYYLSKDSGLLFFVDQYYTAWLAHAVRRKITIVKELEAIYAYLPAPDLSIYLEVTTATALTRLQCRVKGDQILNEQNPLRTLTNMKDSFDLVHRSVPYRQVRVDAEKEPEEVYTQVLEMITVHSMTEVRQSK